MPKPVRSNIYTYQVGNSKSINRSYNFINARDGGQGPAFFWNNYWTSFRPGPPVKTTIEVDNLVIGSGIGGTYMAARLTNFKPTESLLVVDKLSNYGGLQTSTQIPGTDTFIDLGPIRFYESIHPRVYYLSQKYNSPLIEYLPDATGQVCYLRDKKFDAATVFPDSDEVYNIREDEKNVNPFQTLTDNLIEFFPEPEKLAELETRIQLFKNVPYSRAVFQTLAQQNISQENWQRISDILGYNDLLSVKINFIIDSLETLSLTNKGSKQYRFKNGYSSLTETIASMNNLQTIDFDSLNPNSFDTQKQNTLFNTAVLNVEFSQPKQMWEIQIGQVAVTSPEEIDYTPTAVKTIYAKTIYSTIPLLYLKNIHKFSNSYLNLCENSFVNFQIMRVFLKFETDWMTEMGIGFGKSVTTLNGAQLIHYADKVLMFYSFSTQSSKLYGLLPDDIQIQKEMIAPDDRLQPFIDECISIILKSYGIDTLPNINGVAYASWIHPIRCYSGRNLQTLSGESLYDSLMSIMFPYGQNGNFYVLENNSSFNAAWCEGSLEIVDFYMNLIYGQPLFGETLIK